MFVEDQTTYDQQIQAKKDKDAGKAVGPDGRPIPNAGVYGQEQANAELSWQTANTNSLNKLRSYQNRQGVLADGSVDPRNTYGGYQQLLHNQGSELDQAQESAMGRGLGGGPGLGNQAERGLRFGHAVQNLGFQRGLSDAQSNYGMELGQNDANRRNAMTAALQNALNNAWGDWTPPEMQQGGGGEDGGADPNKVQYAHPNEMARWKASTNQFTQRYKASKKKATPSIPPGQARMREEQRIAALVRNRNKRKGGRI